MPHLNGREALAEIRKSPGLVLTPVIAVTASALLEDEGELRERFNGYLRKPFSKDELFAEVSQFLPRRTKPGTPPEPGGAAAAGAATRSDPMTAAAAPPELVSELRRVMVAEWRGIHDNLAINETKVFAGKLDAFAKRWPYPPLAVYAQALAQAADIYDVVGLEAQLNELPALLEQWSRPIPS
jgi:CheY-like chemotaxis protein